MLGTAAGPPLCTSHELDPCGAPEHFGELVRKAREKADKQEECRRKPAAVTCSDLQNPPSSHLVSE